MVSLCSPNALLLKRHCLLRVVAVVLLTVLTSSPIAFSLSTSPQRYLAADSLPSSEYVIASTPLETTAVAWDGSSLVIGGQRRFLFCGEFHSWRLPVPELWLDVLEKIAAAGFNCVSVYTHWGIAQSSASHTPALSGLNDVERVIKYAQSVGLFVVVRPGPYINAETTAGGVPPFLININATLRTNDTLYEDAWKPYIKQLVEKIRPWQLTLGEDNVLTGGGVLLVQAENEYHAGPRRLAYMKEVVRSLKDWGITVPITYNDSGEKRELDMDIVKILDIWGFDSYPQRFNCSQPDVWYEMPGNYSAMHKRINVNQPLYIPEFQAGSYDPFEGPGYEACKELIGPEFARVANHILFSQRTTMLSLYMLAGGTNWGGLAEPDVYTSYDYSAAISETRELTTKYHEYKLQGLFLRSFPDLVTAEEASVTTTGSRRSLLVTELHNTDTNSRFYFVRHANMTSKADVHFDLAITTSCGIFHLARVVEEPLQLDGRDSRIIVTDHAFPNGAHLVFTTARVSLAEAIGTTDVLVLQSGLPIETVAWKRSADDPVSVEAFFEGIDTPHLAGEDAIRALQLKTQIIRDGTVVLLSYSIPKHASTTHPSYVLMRIGTRRILVVLASDAAASHLWAPVISTEPVVDRAQVPPKYSESLGAYWAISSNATALVTGIPFTRRAMTSPDGSILHLWGNNQHTAQLHVLAADSFKKLSWNGVVLETERTAWGGLCATVDGLHAKVASFVAPDLSKAIWRRQDSLPEIKAGFDDSSWTAANRTESFNPYFAFPAVKTEGQVLFAGEYGYHANNIVWRGRFESEAGCEKALRLTMQGGKWFAFSVWLNGHFLGTGHGDRQHPAAEKTFPFHPNSLATGSNVLTIVQDHMGYEMEYGPLDLGPVLYNNGKRFLKRDGDDDIDDNITDASDIEATKLPRGIIAYHLSFEQGCTAPRSRSSGPRITWKVAGNLGGEHAPDKVRTYLNEGGLFAERQGWHLPGFDDSQWEIGYPWNDGQPTSSADHGGSITFYRTTFNLSLPTDHDVKLSIDFPADSPVGTGRSKGTYRALLYVNGWQMGKRLAEFGPQTSFPIPRGVLVYSGDDPNGVGSNTVGLSLWAVEGGERNRRLEAPLSLRMSTRWRGTPAQKIELDLPTWTDLRGG